MTTDIPQGLSYDYAVSVGADPTQVEAPGTAQRFFARAIRDPRDVPFVDLSILLTVTVVPTGIALLIPGGFRWWLAALHVGLVVYFMGPFVLMLHNTSHRVLYRPRFRWLNAFIPWVLGPFFGESPETYFAHHVGMHHPENNLAPDLSSTLPYRRDSFTGFLTYFLLFIATGIVGLTRYFSRKRRRALMLRCLGGELAFVAGVAVLVALSGWRGPLVVFVVPFFVTRFAMMAGNWGQHAFVDQAAPGNCYRNSITCINSAYNRRCFNDGYHIGHHIKPSRHWTEMPGDFARNLETYRAERAIVFRGIDFFGVWVCLMLKRYDWLAARMVPLGGVMSVDERVALMRARTGWTSG